MSGMESPAGLEVNYPHSGLEPNTHATVYPDQTPQFYDHQSYSQNEWNKAPNGHTAAALPPERRVCGLSRKTFCILVAAGIIIIAAAALGGGLGGGLSHSTSAAASPQPTPAPSPSTTSPASASAGTTPPNANAIVVSAQVGTTASGTTVTLYRDCPSANNSLYSVQYPSAAYAFRKLCGTAVTNDAQNVNWVSRAAGSLNDCVNLCAAWNENNVTKANAAQVCSAVCWRFGFADDDLPGLCFGFTSSNASSGGFNAQPDGICDSAAWINQA